MGSDRVGGEAAGPDSSPGSANATDWLQVSSGC